MLESRLLFGIKLLAGLLLCSSISANAVVRIVVPFAPGAAADNLARTIQPELSRELSQPVVIEYRQGAGGDIAAEYVTNTTSKDVVLLLTSTGIVTNSLLRSNQNYDFNRLVPVSFIGTQSLLLVVGNKSPMKNFVEWRRARSTATYGSSGQGSATHVMGEIFAKNLGHELQHIPYKGIAQATIDVLNGNVDFMFDYDTHAIPFVREQQLIAVAVAAPTRLSKLPDVPTFKELGINGMDIQPWWALFANPSADEADLSQVQSALVKVFKNTVLFQPLGIEVRGSAISKDFLQQERQRYNRIIGRTKIQLD